MVVPATAFLVALRWRALLESPRRPRNLGAWGAVAPLLVYSAIFLGLPTWALLYQSIRRTDPATGVTSFTAQNLTTSWHGIYSLYEQHAFLVPVPFLGL